jgi:hypothetical protein
MNKVEDELAEAKLEISRLIQRKHQDEELINRMMEDRQFLLPYASQYILERQVCIENETLKDYRTSFDALIKLTQSDIDQIVDCVVKEQRIDLLQKLMENK